jgi:hypothetical protein
MAEDRGMLTWATSAVAEQPSTGGGCSWAAQRPRFSGAAPIDRESTRAKSRLQNGPDLARRKAASAATRCWTAGLGKDFNFIMVS